MTTIHIDLNDEKPKFGNGIKGEMKGKNKQPRVVYVVTDSTDGLYTEMARLSIAALRISNPRSHIKVICDQQHATSKLASNQNLAREVDEYIPLSVKQDSTVKRSRALKIGLRHHIRGKFVYLDSDTIPIDDIGRIFSTEGDVGLALDLNQPYAKYVLNRKVVNLYDHLGWPYPIKYHNGGIIFWNDTPKASQLADRWHANWEVTCKAGNPLDQPSLNHTIQSLPCDVSILKPKYNAMVERESWGWRRPAILHFINWGRGVETIYHSMLNEQVRTGIINTDLLTRLITTGFPWNCERSISRQLACGRYRHALSQCFRRLLPS